MIVRSIPFRTLTKQLLSPPRVIRPIRLQRFYSTNNSSSIYAGAGVLSQVGKAEKLENVSKVLVIGSGGLSIGQAGEFDYSGALKQ